MLKKPDWKDCPEGYKYLAQDRNGSWWWHKEKPEPRFGYNWWSKSSLAGKMASENPNWKETLEKNPVPDFSNVKVGDWVKLHNGRYGFISSRDNDTCFVTTFYKHTQGYDEVWRFDLPSGKAYASSSDIKEIAKPEDVIFEVGVLKGKVRKFPWGHSFQLCIIPADKPLDDSDKAVIPLSMIPEGVRKIAEDLLDKVEDSLSKKAERGKINIHYHKKMKGEKNVH